VQWLVRIQAGVVFDGTRDDDDVRAFRGDDDS
jgi:hypothetical protein